MAQAIRFCKTTDPMVGDNVFDVSRPHILSNPYTHIKDKKTLAKRVVADRDTAIALYDEYFDMMLSCDKQFKEAFDKMYEAFKTYDKIYIGCYCKENEHCHGDIIIKKLTKRLVKEKMKELKNKQNGNG